MKKVGTTITNVSLFILALSCLNLYAHTRDPKFRQISVEEGLSHVSVNCILQDHEGFMWFGTENGLNRYDGYRFRIYKNDMPDTTSISDNAVLCLFQSEPGIIWIGTRQGGLNRLDKRTNRFTQYKYQAGNRQSISDNCVNTIDGDNKGTLWVGTANGLNSYNPSDKSFTCYYSDREKTRGLRSDNILSVTADINGVIWIGTDGGGLSRFEPAEKIFFSYSHLVSRNEPHSGLIINDIFYQEPGILWLATEGSGLVRFDMISGGSVFFSHDPTNPLSIGSNSVNTIHKESIHKKNLMWLGTSGGGINIFDPVTGKFFRHKCDLNTLCCLGTNTINKIIEDRSGIIWVGTDCCGLNKYDDTYFNFFHHRELYGGFENLKHDKIWVFCEDQSGYLWIGTSHGLNRLETANGRIKNFCFNSDDPASLSNDEVTSICVDHNNALWIGTENGLNQYDAEQEQFIRYRADSQRANSLSDNSIISLVEDRKGNLWIGTKFGGLNKLDPQRNNFEHFKHNPNDSRSIANTAVLTIIQSAKEWGEDLWIGTFNGGLLKFNTGSERFTHYRNDPNDARSLSHNTVTALYEDTEGRLWIGTAGGGVNIFDRRSGHFDHLTVKTGLLDNMIHNIVVDDHGNLWMGTPRGLSKYDINLQLFRNFHFGNEIHPAQKSFNALFKGRDGTFYFGALNSFISFSPDSLAENQIIPPLAFTGIKVLNEEIPMESTLYPHRVLNLAHDQNFFSFELSVLDYLDPTANQYSYMLEGINSEWVYNQNLRTISFTDIRPGEYTFRFRGANSVGVWNEAGAAVTVIIHPPFWKTWWAYSTYSVLLVLFLSASYRLVLNRERRRNREKISEFQKKKLEEINAEKSKFFANISHEFRTPLSLILGPVERMMHREADADTKQNLTMVYRNTRRLHRLIDQLLDLSRIESGQLPLKVGPLDLVHFTYGIVLEFTPLAESKNISLNFKSKTPELEIYAEADKVEKILSNVISNALKFTPKNGTVGISLLYLPADTACTAEQTHAVIRVADNGPGIPAESLSVIFDRFYQVDHSHTGENKGTGIGLSLAKELVDMHKGKIEVASTPGKGTTFSILFRLGKAHFQPDEIEYVQAGRNAQTGSVPEILFPESAGEAETNGEQIRQISAKNKPYAETVLLVEDNPDVQTYLTQLLQADYNLIQAFDGKAGMKAAIDKIPDLIVSDIMMPKMNGLKLCRKLKTDQRTSHIPIILLTAKASGEVKITGLELGADDYITKPFDSKEMKARLKNLIEQRKVLRKKFSLEPSLKIHDVVPTRIDAEFLNRAMDIIEKYSDNSEFNVKLFCREIGLSRVQLHRKLKALTDNSTTEFIRRYRVRKAAKLLALDEDNVFEVSYRVGFNNLSYFAKCFREEFGMSPSAYRRLLAENNGKPETESILWQDK